MTITQFTILQALQLAGPVAQGQLGDILALDSTTLTRSLRPLLESGWVQRSEGKDRRAWRLTLSKRGDVAYNAATPGWERVQQSLHQKLGGEKWLDSFRSADELTTAAQTIGANR
jgi:DNA-binding MarR family transcriptional regulator